MTLLQFLSNNPVKYTILTLLFFPIGSISNAAPTISSVEPDIAVVGQNENITIHGTGFNGSTRMVVLPDSGNKLKVIGTEDLSYTASKVAIDCNTAYVITGYSFHILDVTDSTDPVVLKEVTLPGYGKAITVRDGRAYLLMEREGLRIFNVSDPANPTVLGNLPSSNYGIDLFLWENIAYATYGVSGLQVIDVSDPANPQEISSTSVPGSARSVVANGHWAYVTNNLGYPDTGGGLYIFDVSNPASPVQVGFVETPGFIPFDLVLDGNFVYVADWDAGMQIVKVSNPQQPVIVGSVNTPGDSQGIAVVGNRAYMVAETAGLHVIDITDTTNPFFIGSIRTTHRATGVAIANNLAYVGAHTLEVIDLTHVTSTSVIGYLPTTGFAESVKVVNSTAYIADQATGLQVIDISDPSLPVTLRSIPIPGTAMDVDVQGNYAYVITYYEGLFVVDLTAGGIIGSTPMYDADPGGGSWGWEVEVEGNYAYVAAHVGGLQVFDISDPNLPSYMGHIETRVGSLGQHWSWARDLEVINGLAYVADQYDGLCIIDVDLNNNGIPGDMFILQKVDTGQELYGLTVSGNYAYLVGSNGLFQVVNLSSPGSPILVDQYAGQYWDIEIAGQTGYLSAHGEGIKVFDMSNPVAPTFLATINTRGRAIGLAIVDDAVYVADGDAGLSVIAASKEIIPLTVSSPSEMSATVRMNFTGDYSIRLFDSTGDDELLGALTFMDQLPKEKAIIVAGYGPHPSNRLWEETQLNAAHAYQVLLEQSYPKENIRYLSAVGIDVDNDGTSDVYGDATLANLEQSITSWAADAHELIIYLIGHGSSQKFIVKHTGSVNEILYADNLASMINSLQNTTQKRAIVIYDSCYSGSFISAIKLQPGQTYDRMLITSSTAYQVSILGNQGLTSFSYQFWENVLKGNDLVQSFDLAAGFMQQYNQDGLLDGNCDGFPNTPSDSSAAITLGRGFSFTTPAKPYIGCRSTHKTLLNKSQADFWVKAVSSNPITRVWAEVIPPGYNPLLVNAPELPTFDLTYSSAERVYTGSYNDFKKYGTYLVSFYASDDQQTISLPGITRVEVPFSWILFVPATTGDQTTQ